MSLPAARDGERGFTLVELLVVILIIGILAAIAIPAFLGQQGKAQDSKAKANARNLVSQMEVCYRNNDGYVGCTTELTTAVTGLPVGSGAGQVRIASETATGYQIVATSESNSGGSSHVFTIEQASGAGFKRTCTPVGEGGCKSNGSW